MKEWEFFLNLKVRLFEDLRRLRRRELELRAGENLRDQANTKAFARSTYNLTSIIMDQVRQFMKFAIVEVVNYAAAI